MSRPYRKIAARALGRALRPGEVVHHINGDRKDNRPENLQVLPSQADHVRLHRACNTATAQEVVALLSLGYTKAEIVARGVSQDRYVDARNLLGLQRGSRKILKRLGRDPVRYSKIDADRARELRANGLSYRQIAEELGVTHTGVRYALRRR